MDKLDVLMFSLGFAAYVAIFADLKSNQRRILQYEAIQEKKRIYFERLREIKYQDELKGKVAAKTETENQN